MKMDKKGLLIFALVSVTAVIASACIQSRPGMCAQVITSAVSPDGAECKEFATPCDVPSDWTKVESCPSGGAPKAVVTYPLADER